MQTVRVTSVLAAPADVVWAAVTTPEAFVHVTRGMLRFPVMESHAGGWDVGTEVTGLTLLFGKLPFSRHTVRIVDVDVSRRYLRTEEKGGVIRRWTHRIRVEPIDAERCSYTDEIELDAGPLTGAVALFATSFYRYRQGRWRALAPVLKATVENLSGARATPADVRGADADALRLAADDGQ